MDGFGFGIEDKSPAVRQHEIMVKDHINAWNRLVENKSPLGIQQDDLNWQPRFEQLMGDDSFRNFLKTDNMKDKITILRDSGLGPNKDMSDQDLAQFLMTHVPSGLTEDPNVSEEAKENVNTQVQGAIGGAIGGGLGGAVVAPKVFPSGRAFGSPKIRAIGALAGVIGGAIGGYSGGKQDKE